MPEMHAATNSGSSLSCQKVQMRAGMDESEWLSDGMGGWRWSASAADVASGMSAMEVCSDHHIAPVEPSPRERGDRSASEFIFRTIRAARAMGEGWHGGLAARELRDDVTRGNRHEPKSGDARSIIGQNTP